MLVYYSVYVMYGEYGYLLIELLYRVVLKREVYANIAEPISATSGEGDILYDGIGIEGDR